MLETKIKEVENGEIFPAIYSTEDRGEVILVKKIISDKAMEGIALLPKSKFGEYSMTWPVAKYKRMGKGSEFTMKFIQE